MFETAYVSAVLLQARDLLGVFSAADTAAADSQPAGQDTTEAAACSMAEAGAERPRQAHARGFSFFQPFQSGMQQVSSPLQVTRQ